MKKFIEHLVCCFLTWSGLPWLIREVYARRKVTIINYHNPEPDVFEEHVRFYDKNYNFVSIDQVVKSIEKGIFSHLPNKSLLITIDDGYSGNAQLFSTLRKYRIPAVIYAVAGVVGTRRHFWFDQLPHRGQSMRVLKRIPDSDRRMRIRIDYDHWDEKEYDNPVALSNEEICAFADSGGSVGSHTLFHPLLDRCDEEVVLNECIMSRERLEKIIGKPVVHFALPNGNMNQSVLNWVQRTGYRSCRTTFPGWVNCKTSPFLLPNFGIADNANIHKAALQVCGLWSILKRLIDSD
jgi:peptidoglycan/xylan/chitin deacetylase (PgdA/CDA1 family)